MKNYEIRVTNYDQRLPKIFCFFGLLFILTFTAKAQSINQSYPTPITANEISGKIAARDLGDARLTAYFYTFEGLQGDVFINVVTSNFNGDVDVFTVDNLRPLTKITIYADASANETGRVIYLRQPTKLILRVEGRTPNDDAATYRIKFAGSFAASQVVAAENSESETPEVKSNNQTDIRVNSVGTIIEVKPKPTPISKQTIARKTADKSEPATQIKIEKAEKLGEETSEVKPKEEKPEPQVTITIDKNTPETEEKIENQVEPNTPETKPTETKPTVVVTDEIAEPDATKVTVETENNLPENSEPAKEKVAVNKEVTPPTETKKAKKSKTVRPLSPATLENIRLVILFKDGSKIERAMSEVFKVGVDSGVLTVISKNGAIGRYSILDVEKMTIE